MSDGYLWNRWGSKRHAPREGRRTWCGETGHTRDEVLERLAVDSVARQNRMGRREAERRIANLDEAPLCRACGPIEQHPARPDDEALDRATRRALAW